MWRHRSSVVQRNVSSVRNDALMSILDEMHEQGVQSRLANKPDMIINYSVASELARYKELVGEYEKQANCELYNAKDVTALVEQNDCVRVELEKGQQTLLRNSYDSLKNTRAHTSEMTYHVNEIESLKVYCEAKEFVSLVPKSNQKFLLLPCMPLSSMKRLKGPSTPVTRKKHVTFSDKPGTSSSNTQKQEVHQKVQQTNIPVIPSTGVNDSTEEADQSLERNTRKIGSCMLRRRIKKK
ncbi:hypothetical protein Tco_0668838 [Tanacetum coccineum]